MILTRDGKEITVIYKQDGSEVEEVKDANGRIIYLASREITGTLPLSFYALGKTLTDYLISGETLQDGTPSPDMPVEVVGCGVKTENLFPFTENMLDADNWTQPSVWFICFDITDVLETKRFGACMFPNFSEGYTPELLVCGVTTGTQFDANTRILTNYGETYIRSFDYSNAEHVYLFIGYGNGFDSVATKQMKIDELFTNWQIMFFDYDASSPTEYIPYGYKLPLTVNGTEYPIYLGQVPTTRRIKKFVFDGTENFARNGQSFAFSFPQLPNCSSLYTWTSYPGLYCNIVPSRTARDAYINANQPGISIRYDGVLKLNIISLGYQIELADFKSYLAAQYEKGTPVTIWYVLAEPETGIVNEPLMRIGEYADTISFAQAGVTIPTVSGANVLDMTSTVKPSQMYINGKIKSDGYGKLIDKNSAYIFDKNGAQLTVHGQTDTPNA